MKTGQDRPADSAGELYFKTDVSPETVFQAIGRLRKDARDEIDRLIRFLDHTDDYVSRELEDSVDDGPIDDSELEPSLCGVTVAAVGMPVDNRGDDLEGEHDGAEPSEDDEYSLCGVTVEAGNGDLEGPLVDNEPSLGWPEGVRQVSQLGGSDDGELAGEPGGGIVAAARRRPPLHRTNDSSGFRVDIDDMRIGARTIRNLSDRQYDLLAPRIDHSEVRL
jgi:hypothetical protein